MIRTKADIQKSYQRVESIIEYGIYLFIIFMFLTKGEGIRNILIFGNFSLWLLTLRYREDLYLLKEPVSVLFWITIGITLFSVIFSISPLQSFYELKDEPLRSLLLFPVIATVMSDEKRLMKAAHVMFFTALLIVAVGYYSYFMHDMPVLKPATPLMSVWHNKFARYLGALLPFSFVLYFFWKPAWLKTVLIISLLLSVFALILSTSRGGFIAFVAMVCVWTVYLAKTKGLHLKKAFALVTVTLLLIVGLAWTLFSPVRQRIALLPEQLSTVNQRMDAWIPGYYAFKERPLLGWGYGEPLFHLDEPFLGTPFQKAPLTEMVPGSGVYEPIGPHNTFLKVLFHQGVVGFIPYIALLFWAIWDFWRKAASGSLIRRLMLVSCVSVLIGNYILHSLVAVLYMPHLAVILGFGMAAAGVDEDSRH